jgi:hypothetical protein
LEHELTVTNDRLQATNEAMEDMRIQMGEMGVEMEKLRSDITRYEYDYTESIHELDDRLYSMERDIEYIFKRIKTRKHIVFEDQQQPPVGDVIETGIECEAAEESGTTAVVAPIEKETSAPVEDSATMAIDTTGPMPITAPDVVNDGQVGPSSTDALAPVEDSATMATDATGLTPITAPDVVDDGKPGPSTTHAGVSDTVDNSDNPSTTAMPPPPPPHPLPPSHNAPVVTLQPATPVTSQDRNVTGVSLLVVPQQPEVTHSRPRSTSRSRSPSTASGELRRSPRGLTPAPPSTQGTSSKRAGDAPENEPPAKKSKGE